MNFGRTQRKAYGSLEISLAQCLKISVDLELVNVYDHLAPCPPINVACTQPQQALISPIYLLQMASDPAKLDRFGTSFNNVVVPPVQHHDPKCRMNWHKS
jgi:hypothetical protein